jgi:hypothetical protein
MAAMLSSSTEEINMTDVLLNMNAASIGGTIIPGGQEARKVVGATGVVTVKGIDAPSYLQAGAKLLNARVFNQALPVAPRAASAGRLVASTSFANGTLSIANQPDVPRQGILVVDPGTTAISDGNVAVRYVGNDGVDTTDNISPVTPLSTIRSVTTSKGIVSLTSVIATGLAGGASPKIQLNDSNSLSMSVPPSLSSFAMVRGYADGVVDGTTAVASSAASYTPSTTPNGTHTYSAMFSGNAP